MKKSLKKFIACGVMLAMPITLNSSLVFAASSESATINGAGANAYSNISRENATSGTVSSSPTLKMSVSSTYSYVNPGNLKTGSKSNSASGTAAAALSFSAPKNYRSVRISSQHTASYSSGKWTASTSDTY